MPANPKPLDDVTSPVAPATPLMSGSPFGRVYPGPVSPPLDHLDARTQALRTFAKFVSLLRFQRTGETPDGPPVSFRVPLERIHLYQPDDVQAHAPREGIGILPGRASHEDYGLGPNDLLDDTADVYGQGLVLVRRSDHVETLGIEVVAAKDSERRGVLAGLKEVFGLDDTSGALRLTCEDYFGRVASFRLEESENIDDADATLNRRRAHLYVLLVVQEVSLVAYAKTRVTFEVGALRGDEEEDGAQALDIGASASAGDGNVQVDQTIDPGNVQVDQTIDPGNVQTDG